MKQIDRETWQQSWSAVVDCIARNEPEHALGIFRIITHIMGKSALTEQIRGDIFLACHDIDKAVECYEQAALLYEKNKKHRQALAVYHHILMLQPTNVTAIQKTKI